MDAARYIFTAPFIEREMQCGGQNRHTQRLILAHFSATTHPERSSIKPHIVEPLAFTKYRPPRRWRGSPCLASRDFAKATGIPYAFFCGAAVYFTRARSIKSRYPERHDRFPAAQRAGEQASRCRVKPEYSEAPEL